jgi:3-mercaptopyruvate sulfurtransferase SseA
MKTTLATLMFVVFFLGAPLSFAQQQPRYPVDPQTKWATGAKQKVADELKKQLAAGTEVLIIDVRGPTQFEKETLPGAINIPLAELQEHLKDIPKDKLLVFT